MMISEKNKKYLSEKYNIDADIYTEEQLQQILSEIINRNDRIIYINYQKVGLLSEINEEIGSYLSKGR